MSNIITTNEKKGPPSRRPVLFLPKKQQPVEEKKPFGVRPFLLYTEAEMRDMEDERERKEKEERERKIRETIAQEEESWQMKDNKKSSNVTYEESEDGTGYLKKKRNEHSIMDTIQHRFVNEEDDEFPSEEDDAN